MGVMQEISAFEELCEQLRGINRRNVSKYSQVKLIGRDCYFWQGYVVKSSPDKWNFKTLHELKMLKYIGLHSRNQHFSELIADVTVDNRVFLLLRYIPSHDLLSQFYKHKWQVFKLLPSVIRAIEQEGQIILDELSRLGIVHRDITPSNFLFDFWNRHLVLIDFGFAIHEGEEIQTDSQETQELLERVIKHNLGGEYRKPNAEFCYETDKYSFEKIIQELKSMSPWAPF
jgi:serine/threonine protein kinase